MFYEKFEDYLNTEHRKAIKHYIEKGNKEMAMECVDYLLDKYRESMVISKFLEDKLGDSMPQYNPLELIAYVGDRCRPINWDTMESVFDSEEEEKEYLCLEEGEE